MGAKILLAAGGTGGHLFPAFALLEELKRRGASVHVVTDERVDRYKSDTAADGMHVVPSATVSGWNPFALLKTAMKLGDGYFKAKKLIKELEPDFVLGFGGYPTFPPLHAAADLGVPTGLHDQNAIMGRANRMLARKVDVIATCFESVKNLPEGVEGKVHLTGNPVRDKVLKVMDIPYPDFQHRIHLLIFGGSQGARFFSDMVPEALSYLDRELKSRLSVVQQCRPEDLMRVREVYQAAGISANCQSFFEDLPAEMAAAHLIICRSGASTVAELAVCGRPAIMVPLPHALDNDQLLNARSLVDAGGGWIKEQKTIEAPRLAERVTTLLSEPHLLQAAARNAKSMGRPDAVKALADLVLARCGS